MLAVEEYDAIWSGIRDRAGVLVAEGETDLSRVVRRLEREWSDMSLESKGGTAFGRVVVLPRAALLGARRDVIVHVLKSACNPRTTMVVELGSGWGRDGGDGRLARARVRQGVQPQPPAAPERARGLM